MNKAAPVLQQRTNKPMRCCGQAGFSILSVALFVTPAYSQASASWRDPSSHVVRFVTVEKGVRLEVLDWGRLGFTPASNTIATNKIDNRFIFLPNYLMVRCIPGDGGGL